jgi:hypothetical protein
MGDMDAVPESPRDRVRRERAERAARQEARAAEAIRSIMTGGDLSAETLALSNEFTDETSARIRKRLGMGRSTSER